MQDETTPDPGPTRTHAGTAAPPPPGPTRRTPPLGPGPDGWWTRARRRGTAVALTLLTVALLVGEWLLGALLDILEPLTGEVFFWVGGPLLVAAAGAVGFRRLTGRSVWGERRWRWTDLGWGALAGAAVLGADVVLGGLFELLFDPGKGPPAQAWIDEALLVSPILVGIGVGLATPVGEEVVVRGLLLRGLTARWGVVAAVGVSSVFFGLLHLDPGNLTPAGWVPVIGGAVAGVLFAVVFLRTGHLLGAITAHAVVNGTYVVLGLLAVTGSVLTAGPDGDVAAFDLPVGACALAPWSDGDAPEGVREVACDEPHDLEVAWRGEVPGGPWEGTTPRDDAVVALAVERCIRAFEAYVGADWASSRFDQVAVLPDGTRWAAGERHLLCLVVSYDDAALVGSTRDSGR